MASTMAYELSTSTYECMVCWDVVRPAHHTWSCDKCWAVFHINCIEKWAVKSLNDTSTNTMITSWRCPGCQHKRTAIPHGYFCFCGKQQNPNPSHYQTPHTCEQLCKKSRRCPHPCTLPCHPGPCPPCSSMGPVNKCFCGRDRKQTKCIDTDYETNSYPCEKICDQLLGCGKHRCEKKCHPGLCDPCLIEDEHQSCYCGQSERITRCGDGLPSSSIDGRIGHYECEKFCTSTFDCGIHKCGKKCHPCTEVSTCPYDPSIVKTCPCGSTAIEGLLDGQGRTTCTDPIPLCGGICHKLLPCGHTCQQKCHRGECGPCGEYVKVPCQCQSTESEGICSTIRDTPITCTRVCKALRHCGRHTCGGICCPANKSKGKKRTPGTEKYHNCPLECDKLLSCGKHRCKQACHKGPCRPCLEAVFEEMVCNCGRTRLQPPIRCGTSFPPCPHPCVRSSPCGHIRLLQHNCHPDDEPCPPCPILISRQCVCGKTTLKNIPCHRENAHCGLICDKELPCGQHKCRRTCHDGDCLTEGQSCSQNCTLTRISCGHPCLTTCHGSSPCPETDPCPARIRATCDCGQNTMTIPCNSSATTSGSNQKLDCNDFCAKIERNRRLASALDIQREDVTHISDDLQTMLKSEGVTLQQLSTDDLGYYDDSLRSFYMENASWCKQMEKQLIDFTNHPDQQSLHFKPMRPAFRRFLHRYSIHFNISTEAMDPEPYRSVCLRKNLGQPRIPPILLSKAIHDPKLMAPPSHEIISSLQDINASSSNHPNNNNNEIKPQKRISRPPVNAIQFSGLTFGTLEDDLNLIIKPILSPITFSYKWSDDGHDVVMIPHLDHVQEMEEKENSIWQWKKGLQNAFLFNDMVASIECCWMNRNGDITWSELVGRKPSTPIKSNNTNNINKNRFNLLEMETEQETNDSSHLHSDNHQVEDSIKKEQENTTTTSSSSSNEEVKNENVSKINNNSDNTDDDSWIEVDDEDNSIDKSS
ncbi:unnamed protein product [Cunninghamella blakesleeana]